MDVGKKCLIMGIIGAILAIVSSPFLTRIIFTGRPIETPVEERILEPYPPNVFESTSIIEINRTIFPSENKPYKVMEFRLSPGEGREQYKVLLNVETNGTIEVSISSRNSTFNEIRAFNAGNHTVELQASNEGIYLLNVTRIEGNKVGVNFKIIESWYYARPEIVFKIDYLRTLGGIIGFPAGVILLVGAMVKLRKAVREARPETVERTAARRRYIEVEEEEE